MHVPVLLNEVIRLLDPKPGEFIIDGTLGAGGYSEAILERIGPTGKLLGVDWDKNTVAALQEKFLPLLHQGALITLVNDNFANIPEILDSKNLGLADGLVLDLGFSSEQLENSGRGFSFLKDEPLLMTYSDESEPVREILKRLTAGELEEIIKKYSQEKFAKNIATAIKDAMKIKPITTSKELGEIIQRAVPKSYERGRLNPATRTFMALRIYANRELENLEAILRRLPEILKSGGRAAIVSFHSEEDRLVKNYFRDLYKNQKAQILTKKPITAAPEEIQDNPRSRSAKLRVIRLN